MWLLWWRQRQRETHVVAMVETEADSYNGGQLQRWKKACSSKHSWVIFDCYQQDFLLGGGGGFSSSERFELIMYTHAHLH